MQEVTERHHHHVSTTEPKHTELASPGVRVALEKCRCGARRDVMFGGRRGPWVVRRGRDHSED